MPFSEIFEQYQHNSTVISKKDYLSKLGTVNGIDTSPHIVKGLRGETETYIVIGNTGLYINISTKPLEVRKGEVIISNIHFKPEGSETPIKGRELRTTLLGVMGLLGFIDLFNKMDPDKKIKFISTGSPNNDQLKNLLIKLPQKYGGVDLSSLRDMNHPIRQQLERIAAKAKNLKNVQPSWE